MANQLGMDKSLAIGDLLASGMYERAIAGALDVSRNAARNHLAAQRARSISAPTGSEGNGELREAELSRSLYEPFREIILAREAARSAVGAQLNAFCDGPKHCHHFGFVAPLPLTPAVQFELLL